MIIVAYGNPAPQGSKNYLGRTKMGRGIVREVSDKLDPWRADVMRAARDAIDEYRSINGSFEPYSGAVIARMAFSFLRPKTVSRNKRPFMTVAPDLSKLVRGTEDALQAAGVLRDDALVVRYTGLAKVYCNEDPESLESPGAVIHLAQLVDLAQLKGAPPFQAEKVVRVQLESHPGQEQEPQAGQGRGGVSADPGRLVLGTGPEYAADPF